MNDLDQLFRGRLKSCKPLRHIRHWLSWKLLDIEAWFQRTTNRKWPCCDLRLSSVCDVMYSLSMAKRCVLQQKWLLTAYRKSYMRNRLVPKQMTLTFVSRGRLRSCESLRHIRHWISGKPSKNRDRAALSLFSNGFPLTALVPMDHQ